MCVVINRKGDDADTVMAVVIKQKISLTHGLYEQLLGRKHAQGCSDAFQGCLQGIQS